MGLAETGRAGGGGGDITARSLLWRIPAAIVVVATVLGAMAGVLELGAYLVRLIARTFS